MSEERRFDWGPPVQSGDNLKEWLVYFVIAAILGVGAWFLLDINGRRSNNTIPSKAKTIIATDVKLDQKLETFVPIEKDSNIVKKEQEPINSIPAVSVPKTEFYVQIGAFADEESANESYTLLKNEEIPAKILKPDEQFEIYRLVAGPYPSESEAESRAEQLNNIGFPCFVVEAQ